MVKSCAMANECTCQNLASGEAVSSNSWLEVDLQSVDFETNEMVVILPKEIVARGFHAGKVMLNLSGVQRTSNVTCDLHGEKTNGR